MVYSGGGISDNDDNSNRGGEVVVVTAVQRVQILCWTHLLTCTLNSIFSFIKASSTLLVYLTLSTNYLTTDYCSNKFLYNILKKGMSTLDGTHRRFYHSSIYIGHKKTLQYKASIQNFYTNNIYPR